LNYTEQHFQLGLSFLQGIGPKKAAQLVSKTGSPEAVFQESIMCLHQQTTISKSVLKQMNRTAALEKADKELEFISRNQIRMHFYLDKDYPRRLRQCVDAPIVLFGKGNYEINGTKTVAIVGTRAATGYGKRICEELIERFEDQEIQVISGMAYGIDICAHQLCVKKNISTIGVLGHGLDRIYPYVHRKIAEQMIENGGLLTEFLPGTKPDRENFPMRNRIVAGMTDATIVVESKLSGGSLITADLANDYNRDVFAFPGNIGQEQSAGCNSLIKTNKAHLVMNGQDFLTQMNWTNDSNSNKQQKICLELTQDEKVIYDLLAETEKEHIDVLSIKSGKPSSQINVLLFQLEMKNAIDSLPGKLYRIRK
jgi:DNA processing protein